MLILTETFPGPAVLPEECVLTLIFLDLPAQTGDAPSFYHGKKSKYLLLCTILEV